MKVEQQQEAIREGLKHLVLVGDCTPCFCPGGPSCGDCTPADNKTRNILAFLTEKGAVLKVEGKWPTDPFYPIEALRLNNYIDLCKRSGYTATAPLTEKK